MTTWVSKVFGEKVKWRTIVDLKSDPLTFSLSILGDKRRYHKKALDLDFESKTYYYFENTVAQSEKDMGVFFGLVQRKLFQDKKYFFDFPQRVYKLTDSLLEFSTEIQKIESFENYTNERLEKLFSQFIEKAANAWPLLNIGIVMEIIVTEELEKFIQQKLEAEGKASKFDDYFQAITQRFEKKTFFQQDYRSLLSIGKEIQKDKSLVDKFRSDSSKDILHFLKEKRRKLYNRTFRHNRDYSWLNMDFFRRHPFTLEETIDRLKDILEKDCERELENLGMKAKKAELNFKKANVQLGIKGELRDKTELLGEYLYLRTYRLDVFSLAAYKIRNLLFEIASKLDISYDELVYLTLWEIKDALLGKVEISKVQIKKRLESFAYIKVNSRLEIITDKNILKQLLKDKTKKTTKKINVIKGSVASKGKARGTVKVVIHPTQITKVEKGDVLVAPMTSPDFVLGMLKVVAIVTDHGGITSHAAIVSRELGVPCIVGTKIATQVLRDGDFVEVDAEKGIVTKVARNKS